MSNPHRGDTDVKVGGEKYILCYDLNACALIMDKLGLDQFEDMAEVSVSVNVKDMIYVLWAGLQRHHEELTEKDVGGMDWDMEELPARLQEAFRRSLVRKTKPDLEGVDEKKVTRRSGTGRRRA